MRAGLVPDPRRRPHAEPHQARITDTGDWHAMLGAYAQLQLDLARHVGDLLALGLADLRPGSVPGQFAKLLDDPATEQRGTR